MLRQINGSPFSMGRDRGTASWESTFLGRASPSSALRSPACSRPRRPCLSSALTRGWDSCCACVWSQSPFKSQVSKETDGSEKTPISEFIGKWLMNCFAHGTNLQLVATRDSTCQMRSSRRAKSGKEPREVGASAWRQHWKWPSWRLRALQSWGAAQDRAPRVCSALSRALPPQLPRPGEEERVGPTAQTLSGRRALRPRAGAGAAVRPQAGPAVMRLSPAQGLTVW